MRPEKAAIVVACVLACGLAGSAQVALAAKAKAKTKGNANAAAETEGRKHARKANHLADINKCRLAIPEYATALRLLQGKDPALLFNRAECYRRTGNATKAVADYRKFLTELPAAPNRAQVESQIAALAKPGVAPSLGPSSSPSSRPSSRPAMAVAPASAEAVREGQDQRPSEPTRIGKADEFPPPRDLDRPSPLASEGGFAVPPAPVSAPGAPALAETDAPMALVDTKPQPERSADTEHGSSHWWIWAVGAVVVAGGTVGAYFALNQGKTDIPTSTLGNYKF